MRKYRGNCIEEGCAAQSPMPEPDKAPDLSAADGSMHQIFLVPHTHDDVGWLYTVGGYFNSSVHHILDTVTADLAANPSHRFIWSEIKWIELWWPLQNETTRSAFRRIVANGQFEFVGAGWCQHDEVTPSYRDMVGNTVAGHEYLRRILGPLDKACPAATDGERGRCIRFGWQIDMFAGYSATSPSLWTMAGYDGMVIRFEGPDSMRERWDAEQLYEYMWEPSKYLKPSRSRMATHVIRWNYGDMLMTGRNGSAYGFRSPDVSFAFDKKVIETQADVEYYARALVRWSKGRGSVYRGNRHLAVWGSDFQFTDAGLWFSQMDRLVHEINENPAKYNATIQYSTLATYFDQLHTLNQQGNPTALMPVQKELDFQFGWPHTWAPHGIPLIGMTANYSWQYQTGAASSRPAHKQRVRKEAALLRAAQAALVHGIARGTMNRSTAALLDPAIDAVGITQHHDSMPGTMQTAESLTCPDNFAVIDGLYQCNATTDPQHQVLEDYSRRLDEAAQASSSVLFSAIEAIHGIKPGSMLKNRPADESGAKVIVYNPTLHRRTELLQVSFGQPKNSTVFSVPTVYKIGEGSKTAVVAQIEVNDKIMTQETNSHAATTAYASSVWFSVSLLPFTSAVFEIQHDASGANSTTTYVPEVLIGSEEVGKYGLGYPHDPQCLRADFNLANGLIREVSIGNDGLGCNSTNLTKIGMRQTYWQYVDPNGGAYCLIEQTRAVELPLPYRVALTRGPLFQEVVQSYSFGNGLQQRTRIEAPVESSALRTLAITHSAGILPENRELISRIESDLESGATLFTEASGMSEMYERQLNKTASVGQNYHAIVQTAAIRDYVNKNVSTTASPQRQLTLLTPRTMGIAALGNGELEYMLMRRITTGSDNQGPWPLNDKKPQEDTIQLMIAPVDIAEKQRFPAAIKLENSLEMVYLTSSHYAHYASPNQQLSQGLPSEVWGEVGVRIEAPPNALCFVRLQNVVAGSESVTLPSLATSLGLPSMSECTETTLTMQQLRSTNEKVRFEWRSEDGYLEGPAINNVNTTCNSAIVLDSLDIRTFTFKIGK